MSSMVMWEKCPNCGNLYLEEYNDYGAIYMKCPRCGWDERDEDVRDT